MTHKKIMVNPALYTCAEYVNVEEVINVLTFVVFETKKSSSNLNRPI